MLLLVFLLLLLILLIVLMGKKKVKFMVGTTVYHKEKVKRGEKLVFPVQPRKPGFLFIGWSEMPRGGVCWNEQTDEVKKSIKLYAQWKHV